MKPTEFLEEYYEKKKKEAQLPKQETLYTEEQVREALKYGVDNSEIIKRGCKDIEGFIQSLKQERIINILISDEEIEKAKENAWSDYEYQEGNLYSTTFSDGWKMAIKWYREQLKSKGNETEI